MTISVKKVSISSKLATVSLSCPPLCGLFSIQLNANGGLSYKEKKRQAYDFIFASLPLINLIFYFPMTYRINTYIALITYTGIMILPINAPMMTLNSHPKCCCGIHSSRNQNQPHFMYSKWKSGKKYPPEQFCLSTDFHDGRYHPEPE